MHSGIKRMLTGKIISIVVFFCLVSSFSVTLEPSDWLITKRGSTIEVQSYYIEGEMVIMRLQNGKLAQIAHEDIDWQRTKELNQSGKILTEAKKKSTGNQQDKQVQESYVSPGMKKKYSGAPINLELKDADIKDVLRFFAEFTGLNFVIDPQVEGKTTIMLKQVPWDQALEVILKNNGLGMVAEGNIYRIAGVQKLTEEEIARRNLAEQQSLSGPLVTIVRRLSYANAGEMAKIIERFLSPRGSVIVDERTNSLIITDIEEVIGEIETQLEL